MKSKDRNEIPLICIRFYTELCSSTHQDRQHSKEYSPGISEVPTIMTQEVKKTLTDKNPNKAPGIDNLTSDVMILAGAESVKQIKTILIRF